MTASTVPDRRAECTRFGCASTRSPTAASISPTLRRVPIREKDPRGIGGLPRPIGGRDTPRQGLPKAVVGGPNEPVVGDFIACEDRITHHDRRSTRLTVWRVGWPVYGSSVGSHVCTLRLTRVPSTFRCARAENRCGSAGTGAKARVFRCNPSPIPPRDLALGNGLRPFSRWDRRKTISMWGTTGEGVTGPSGSWRPTPGVVRV
jgi:hypothetical protein